MPIICTAPCPGLVHTGTHQAPPLVAREPLFTLHTDLLTEGNKNYAAQHTFLIKHLFNFISYVFFLSPEKGAHCSLFAAASPLVRSNATEYAGMYIEDMKVGKQPTPSADCCDETVARELWATTATVLTDLGVWEGDNIAAPEAA